MAFNNPTGNPPTGTGAIIGVGSGAPANSIYIASSTGNVGIGTASPGSYKLNVAGDTNITGTANATAYSVGGTAGWTGSYVTVDPHNYMKLLAHFNGTNGQTTYTSDDANARTATFWGTAQLSTTQKKFGTASLYVPGSSYISFPDSDDFAFGAGDFTIDFWARWNNKTDVQGFIGQVLDASYYWYLLKLADDKLYMRFYDGAEKGLYTTTATPTINNDTWYHIAFVRNGANAYIFLDGISLSLTKTNAFADVGNINGLLYIGADGLAAYFFKGWLDEIRISKDIARWTANFTPPTGEYSTGIKTVTVTNGIITGVVEQ